jgi:hypothetical protein
MDISPMPFITYLVLFTTFNAMVIGADNDVNDGVSFAIDEDPPSGLFSAIGDVLGAIWDGVRILFRWITADYGCLGDACMPTFLRIVLTLPSITGLILTILAFIRGN